MSDETRIARSLLKIARMMLAEDCPSYDDCVRDMQGKFAGFSYDGNLNGFGEFSVSYEGAGVLSFSVSGSRIDSLERAGSFLSEAMDDNGFSNSLKFGLKRSLDDFVNDGILDQFARCSSGVDGHMTSWAVANPHADSEDAKEERDRFLNDWIETSDEYLNLCDPGYVIVKQCRVSDGVDSFLTDVSLYDDYGIYHD